MNYKNITKKSYDEVSVEYAKRDLEVIAETHDVKEALDRFISSLPHGAAVLDIGCAAGRDSRYLHKNGLKVTAIDFSEHMIAAAEKLSTGITYKVMDFEHIDFPENEFDGILANASLHHVPKEKLPAILSSIFRILKQGGQFLVIVKHGDFDGIRMNEKFGMNIERHFSHYLPEEFKKVVGAAGFSILDLEVVTGGEWIRLFARK